MVGWLCVLQIEDERRLETEEERRHGRHGMVLDTMHLNISTTPALLVFLPQQMTSLSTKPRSRICAVSAVNGVSKFVCQQEKYSIQMSPRIALGGSGSMFV